jgi:hypothetical protein
MATDGVWRARSPERLPDELWAATLTRVRGEFEEMPCIRVTPERACQLLGLAPSTSRWVLDVLARDGFLSRTPQGEYVRRTGAL